MIPSAVARQLHGTRAITVGGEPFTIETILPGCPEVRLWHERRPDPGYPAHRHLVGAGFGSGVCFSSEAGALEAAGRHADAVSASGRCDGLLLLVPLVPGGRTHLGHPDEPATRCGIPLPVRATLLRAPGLLRTGGATAWHPYGHVAGLTCGRCRRARAHGLED